jgi:hypothetical protein
MADIVPVTSGDWFTNAQRTLVPFDATGAAITATTKRLRLSRLTHKVFPFTDVDGSDDWAGPRGAVAVAWQANTTADQVAVLIGADTTRFLNVLNSGIDGWLHAMVSSPVPMPGVVQTQDIAPTAKGSAGYCGPDSMFISPRAASPNAITTGRVVRKAGLRIRIFPFEVQGDGDIWKTTSERRLPGLAAVAWQAIAASNQCAPTLNASGDVVFNNSAVANPIGFLWCWTRG